MTNNVTVEFKGGVERLFGNITQQKLKFPSTFNMLDLIFWLACNLLKSPREEFITGHSIRPGIMVIVNDIDWDILDTVNYKLQNNDNVAFISTLHGG